MGSTHILSYVLIEFGEMDAVCHTPNKKRTTELLYGANKLHDITCPYIHYIQDIQYIEISGIQILI